MMLNAVRIALAIAGLSIASTGAASPNEADAQSMPSTGPASMYAKIAPSLALIIARDGKNVSAGTAFCIGASL
jgi:hypothetical protein